MELIQSQHSLPSVNQIESENSSITQIQNPSFRLISVLEYTDIVEKFEQSAREKNKQLPEFATSIQLLSILGNISSTFIQ